MTKLTPVFSEDLLKDRFLEAERASGVVAEDTKDIFPRDEKTLFVCAGLQCFEPSVFEPSSPPFKRSSVQDCVKLNALEKVGKTEFLTSFRMLTRLRPILTDRTEMLKLEIQFLEAFLGLHRDELVFQLSDAYGYQMRDTTSEKSLLSLGISESNIRFKPRRWSRPLGSHIATGPNVLVFCRSSRSGVERHIWNFEFLEFAKSESGRFARLPHPVLDSAGNLECALSLLNDKDSVYETGSLAALHRPISQSFAMQKEDKRILADHFRTIALLFSKGVEPAAKSRGYVLRKLMRRCLEVMALNQIELPECAAVFDVLEGFFGAEATQSVHLEFQQERASFSERLMRGRRLFDELCKRPDQTDVVQHLRDTHGVPKRVTEKWMMGEPLGS